MVEYAKALRLDRNSVMLEELLEKQIEQNEQLISLLGLLTQHLQGGHMLQPTSDTAPDTAAMTLDEFYEGHYKPVREQRAAAGFMGKRQVFDEWNIYVGRVQNTFGKMPINYITDTLLEEWRDQLLIDGYATSSVVKALALVSRMMKVALKKKIIVGANPADGVKVEKRRGDHDLDRDFKWVKPDELDPLFEYARTKLSFLQYTAITVAAYTGLRLNELKSLHRSDVHLDGDKPYLVVRYGAVPHKERGKWVRTGFGPTKNGKIQKVVLLPQAARALREWLDRNPVADKWDEPSLHGVKDQNGVVPKGGLVFASPDGGPYAHGYEFDWYRAEIPQNAFGRKIVFHDLRHTFCTHLALGTWTKRPCELLEISQWARHSNTKITERYIHVARDHLHSLQKDPDSVHTHSYVEDEPAEGDAGLQRQRSPS